MTTRRGWAFLFVVVTAAGLAYFGGSEKSGLQGAAALYQERLEAAPPQSTPFVIRVGFGYLEETDPLWTGSFKVSGIRVVESRGWQFRAADRLSLTDFEFRTVHPATKKPEVKGLFLRGSASPGARIDLSTNRGDFSIALDSLRAGDEQRHLNGAVRVSGFPGVEKLTDDLRDDDYPSIAALPDGTAWAVWQSYSGLADQIRLSRYDQSWRTFTQVPGTSGDVWRPQVVLDGSRRPWVIWSQQLDGNFDLWARALDEEQNIWLDPVRLSSRPHSDFDHHAVADSAGRIWVVWQAFDDDNLNIFLRWCEEGQWSEEIRVTEHPANDWEPQLAVDGQGKAYVVWDSYRNGNYDVYMRSFQAGRLGEETAVADTPRFEAHATAAVDAEGRLWVAWDEAGPDWGKDTGVTDDPNWRDDPKESWSRWWATYDKATRMYDGRRLNLAVFQNGRRLQPSSPLSEALAAAGIENADYPQLLVDPVSNRLALLFHRWTMLGEYDWEKLSKPTAFWEQALILFEGDRWSAPITLPESRGRLSMRTDAAPAGGGGLWLIWPTDGRRYDSPYQPRVGNVFAARLQLGSSPSGPAQLRDWEGEPPPPQREPIHPQETQDVAAIRSYRTFIQGEEHRIVRGDFHRHTEFSWDNGGLRDGSLFDFYRYVLDAAALDFGAVTDHNAGGDHEYWWWLSEKSCDLYHIPRTFTTFYAYERSVQYPGGHRNIFHTRRGVPVVSFFTETAFQRPRPGIVAFPPLLVENDTKLLYQSLHQSGGLSIPHTTATNGGTNWQDNDPIVEPVVEIYQGARHSFEHPGAPRAARTAEDFRDFREDGFVWSAYRKGYKIGTIASSDHFSTHISYAMVYTPEPTREAIFEAIRKRRTYGATDNIILDCRMGRHFMGEEFKTSQLPPLQIRIGGTRRITSLEIIRNEKVIFSTHPDQVEVNLTYIDQDPAPGQSYYYVRAIQEDGEMVWGSPIWVELRP